MLLGVQNGHELVARPLFARRTRELRALSGWKASLAVVMELGDVAELHDHREAGLPAGEGAELARAARKQRPRDQLVAVLHAEQHVPARGRGASQSGKQWKGSKRINKPSPRGRLSSNRKGGREAKQQARTGPRTCHAHQAPTSC